MIPYDRNHMHIIYASDDKFAEILGVSMVSLYENNRDMGEITVYILDSGIGDENRKKIKSICANYGRPLPVWIRAKDISRELGMNVKTDRGSLSQYSRLFISSLLPENLTRVLYLDCDTIVNKPLRELWNLDLEGKTVGALMDAFSKYYRKNIGLQPNDIMFNSGVMLIDLNKWKEQKIEEKLLQFIRRKNGKVQQGDQGALNAVLSRDIYCFEPRFNSVTIFYDFSYKEMLLYRKPPIFYSESEVKEAVEEPVVIHFTTSFLSKRPWVEGCRHAYATEWKKYKDRSPWKAIPPWINRRKKSQKLMQAIFAFFPRRLALCLAGSLQAYGRPMVEGFKV